MSGWIYYIACTATMHCKIGFTAGDPIKRMRGLQTGAPAPLVLLAVHPGTMEDERKLHEQFAEHCVHGEWFAPSEQLLERVSLVTWIAAKQAIACDAEVPDWVRTGLITMNEMNPLPEDLAALI